MPGIWQIGSTNAESATAEHYEKEIYSDFASLKCGMWVEVQVYHPMSSGEMAAWTRYAHHQPVDAPDMGVLACLTFIASRYTRLARCLSGAVLHGCRMHRASRRWMVEIMFRVVLMGMLCLVGVAALITGARAIGHMQDQPPLYLETGDCAQPCWQGFQPGPGLQANALLTRIMEVPYSVGRISEYRGGYISMFEIYPGGNLTLADILRAWGPPERVGCMQLSGGKVSRTLGSLYYFDGLVAARLASPEHDLRLSPGMAVSALQYYQPGDPVYAIGETVDWRGLAGVPMYPTCYNY